MGQRDLGIVVLGGNEDDVAEAEEARGARPGLHLDDIVDPQGRRWRGRGKRGGAPAQRLGQAGDAHGLAQVVQGVHLEGPQRKLVVSGDEDDPRRRTISGTRSKPLPPRS